MRGLQDGLRERAALRRVAGRERLAAELDRDAHVLVGSRDADREVQELAAGLALQHEVRLREHDVRVLAGDAVDGGVAALDGGDGVAAARRQREVAVVGEDRAQRGADHERAVGLHHGGAARRHEAVGRERLEADGVAGRPVPPIE